MNNIIKINLLSMFILLIGCAHEPNIVSLNKKINLPALKPEHPVTVYTEKPDFGYEVVCEAKIKDSRYYAEDVLSYEKVAKEQVRACGTDLAYVKDFYHETFKVGTTYHYNKYSKTVYASNDYRSYSGASILGIRRNTDSAKIINDMPSKLGLAMGVDNVKVFRTLLKGLSKDPKQMFSRRP